MSIRRTQNHLSAFICPSLPSPFGAPHAYGDLLVARRAVAANVEFSTQYVRSHVAQVTPNFDLVRPPLVYLISLMVGGLIQLAMPLPVACTNRPE
jgi:hypothetical protein